MANVYEVRHSNGQTYTVTTNEHHDNHTEESFKAHLLRIIENSVSGVISGVILAFTFKRRK